MLCGREKGKQQQPKGFSAWNFPSGPYIYFKTYFAYDIYLCITHHMCTYKSKELKSRPLPWSDCHPIIVKTTINTSTLLLGMPTLCVFSPQGTDVMPQYSTACTQVTINQLNHSNCRHALEDHS